MQSSAVRFLVGFVDLSALTEPELGRALSGLTEANVHCLESGFSAHLTTFADRSSLRSLSGNSR